MKLKSIFSITLFFIAVSMQAQHADFASPPGGIPLRYADPVPAPDLQNLPQEQPVRIVLTQPVLVEVRSWVDRNPKLAATGISTLGLAAIFGLSYRYSASFKKDIDEKFARIQDYFKNKYNFNHFLGFSFGASLLAILGYKAYSNWDDIKDTFRN